MTFARSAILYGLGSAAGAATNLAMLPILSRELGPTGYGSLGVFFSLIGLFSSVTGLNLHGLVVNRACARNGTLRPIIGACLYALVASTGTCAAGILAGSHLIAGWTGIPPFWLWLALGASASQFLVNVLLGLWQAEERPVPYGMLTSSIALLGAAISIWLVIGNDAGSVGRILGLLLSSGLGAILACAILLRRNQVDFRPSQAVLHQAARYGLPLIPHVLASWAFLSADRTLVAAMAGLEQAGVYFAAAQLAQIVTMTNDAVNRAWVPWFFRQLSAPGGADTHTICSRGRRIAIAYVVLALLIGASAPLATALLLGGRYAGASTIVLLLALGYALDGVYKLFANVLFFHERTDLVFWVTLSGGVTAVVVDCILLPVMGAAGAAIGLICGATVSVFLSYAFAQRLHRLPWLVRG